MPDLLTRLHDIARLPPATEAALLAAVRPVTLRRGEVLLEIGQVAREVIYLEEGFVLGEYYPDDVVTTSWFWWEGDFVTSLESFLTRQPTIERVRVVEDGRGHAIDHAALQRLYADHPVINEIGRKLMEDYFLRAGGMATGLRRLPARERYERLLAEQPAIFGRTTLTSIASYLGLTKETLSRLRKG